MLSDTKYNNLKQLVYRASVNIGIKDTVAEIYNLFQEGLITEEQESELYKIADPEEKEASPGLLWFANYGFAPLYDYVNGVIRWEEALGTMRRNIS